MTDIVSHPSLWALFTDRETLVGVLQTWGVWGPLLFILIQAAQVVIWAIPGELTGVVGGYLFGTGLGFLYSMVGLTLGSMATFGLGHLLGPPFLRWMLGADRYDHVRTLTNRAGAPVAFVLYLIPGFPKDVLGYLFGASDLAWLPFFVATTVARAPGTWVLSLQGDKAGDHAWGQLALITVAVALLGAACYRYRATLVAWAHGRRDAPE